MPMTLRSRPPYTCRGTLRLGKLCLEYLTEADDRLCSVCERFEAEARDRFWNKPIAPARLPEPTPVARRIWP